MTTAVAFETSRGGLALAHALATVRIRIVLVIAALGLLPARKERT